MRKKISRILSLALAAALFLSACQSSNTTQGNTDTTEGTGATSTEFKEKLVWGQGADITSLDPHIGKETPAVQVTQQIFDTLTTFDDNGDVVPQIAESWEQPDNQTTIFKIRDGIKFHDGTTVTPEDVKFSLERAIASTAVAYIVDFIDTVTVVDESHVEVKTKAPYGPILRNLAVPFSAIVPKAYVEKMESEGKEFATAPVGSGPYKFVEWKQGNSATLEAFADYYAGAPLTPTLEMRVIPDAAQRTIALETGDIDLSFDIQPNDISKINDNSDLVYIQPDPMTAFYLAFNVEKEPLNNAKVRQAIRHAINTDTIVEAMLYGNGQSAGSLVAPLVFGYPGTAPYTYDVEKAKQLLTEAGYPNGFSIKLAVNDNQGRVEVCNVIQGMLQEVGIDVQVDITEFGSFIQTTSSGEHDMAYMGWVTSTFDADYTFYSLVHSSQMGAPGNRAFYNNPAADAAIMKGRNSIDDNVRLEAYKELDQILQEDMPYAPLLYTSVNAASSKKVVNFVADPIGYHKLDKVQVGR